MVHGTTWRTAASATGHCLTGCAIGEVLGVAAGSIAGLSNVTTIALAIVLAFLFGYTLSMIPLFRAGLALKTALSIALAADTMSILVMEIVDNSTVLIWPGAMEASVGQSLFWISLGTALAVAFLAAWPVNYALIKRGKGHAVAHQYHGVHHHDHPTPTE